MTRIYATPADLPAAYQDHADAEELIRRASNLVTARIQSAWFATDANGMPTGMDLLACRDAVVIQVSTWLSTGVSPLTGYVGKPATVTSKGSNGSTVAYAVDLAADAFLNLLAGGTELVGSALVPLSIQGLLTVYVRDVGQASGRLYAREYQPQRYDLTGGFAGFTRAEGVIRLDVRVTATPFVVEGVPDYLWPEGPITQEDEAGVSVTFDAGTLTVTGPVSDYAEAMLLWGASRG